MPSSSSTTTDHRLAHPAANNDQLPPELLAALNQAYLLHMLAVDPDAILPPGKSLLAMLARAGDRDKAGKTDLHRAVEGIAHKAFWDEAIHSLSSPLPAAQLTRLKSLYADLANSLSPLLPLNHPVITSLSLPIPPTSSPLQSCLIFLKEILVALGQRCAPARDDEVHDIMNNLIGHIPPISKSEEATPRSPAAERIVQVIRSIIILAQHMKTDIEQFALGTLSEPQLRTVISQQAEVRERDIIFSLWNSGQEDGGISLRRLWSQWVEISLQPHFQSLLDSGSESQSGRWVLQLIQALGSTIPISCNVPGLASPTTNSLVSASHAASMSSQTNDLPLQFLLSFPALFYLQNYLQALVIASALRSLTRLPPSNGTHSAGDGFMHRIWSLLKGEIDEPDIGPSSTKIVNLEDEVVRARALASTNHRDSASAPGTDPSAATQRIPSLDIEEDSRLRSAVQRTLQPQDPAFLLLQKRLLAGMGRHLLDLVTRTTSDREAQLDGAGEPISGGSSSRSTVPSRMKTGRLSHLSPSAVVNQAHQTPELVQEGREVAPIKGFEDPVLVEAVEEAFEKMSRCVVWFRDTWGSTMQDAEAMVA